LEKELLEIAELLMSSLVRRHDYHFLSLRLVRNPSGFSERFPTSGNDIYVALLIAVLVKVKIGSGNKEDIKRAQKRFDASRKKFCDCLKNAEWVD
jgi:hypothetical protein